MTIRGYALPKPQGPLKKSFSLQNRAFKIDTKRLLSPRKYLWRLVAFIKSVEERKWAFAFLTRRVCTKIKPVLGVQHSINFACSRQGEFWWIECRGDGEAMDCIFFVWHFLIHQLLSATLPRQLYAAVAVCCIFAHLIVLLSFVSKIINNMDAVAAFFYSYLHFFMPLCECLNQHAFGIHITQGFCVVEQTHVRYTILHPLRWSFSRNKIETRHLPFFRSSTHVWHHKKRSVNRAGFVHLYEFSNTHIFQTQKYRYGRAGVFSELFRRVFPRPCVHWSM